MSTFGWPGLLFGPVLVCGSKTLLAVLTMPHVVDAIARSMATVQSRMLVRPTYPSTNGSASGGEPSECTTPAVSRNVTLGAATPTAIVHDQPVRLLPNSGHVSGRDSYNHGSECTTPAISRQASNNLESTLDSQALRLALHQKP